MRKATSLRFDALRPVLYARATEEWHLGSDSGPRLLPTLNAAYGERNQCVAIGVLRCPYRLLPAPMQARRGREGLASPTGSPSLVTEAPAVLEDGTGLLELEGLDMSELLLVNGMVLAVCGEMDSRNMRFEVSAILLPGGAPLALRSYETPLRKELQFTWPLSNPRGTQRHLLAMVSGLRLASANAPHLELGLLRDYLLGLIGTEEDRAVAACISRLLVAGGVHPIIADAEEKPEVPARKLSSGSHTFNKMLGAAGAIDMADLYLAPITYSGITVAVQTGEGDCGVPLSLPQATMPRELFPRCVQSGRFEALANPMDQVYSLACTDVWMQDVESEKVADQDAEVSMGVRVLGTGGQPVTSMVQAVANMGDEAEPPTSLFLKMLHACWKAQHLAPTWPDAFWQTGILFPSSAAREREVGDPFIIVPREGYKQTILFSGNCPASDWESWREASSNEQVTAVCVPAFHKECSMLLVDLENVANVRKVCFKRD